MCLSPRVTLYSARDVRRWLVTCRIDPGQGRLMTTDGDGRWACPCRLTSNTGPTGRSLPRPGPLDRSRHQAPEVQIGFASERRNAPRAWIEAIRGLIPAGSTRKPPA